ncbi:MAG: DciA family protein [Gammaproteobacteria bacterium]|nr:MAG: DciA family protein [Gammaproteobacteria bacterium]
MSEKSLKSLSDLLQQPAGPFADLARKATATEELAATLRASLGPELAAELRAAHLRPDGTLVILAGSPAWASRLRFEAQGLLERCRERHPQAARVRVRVGGG